ncbi:MAG: sensor domain-containing diguanylate cyclase [Lachnospiraceae bacterium]|nr:sensor domain-containing diguanylate cyclase [Lachnospiraceae bacterium]
MKIWNFFENLNEMVYVSDMDTYEMVYMNKKTLAMFGYKSVDEVIGKKCHEVIQNNRMPCFMCNNCDLKPGYFKEWKCFNPRLKKHMLLKDTMIEEDGRRYRLEIAFDVTLQEKQENLIHNYKDMEAFANEGIKLALKSDNPDKSIDIILEYLGRVLDGGRTYIFEKRENGHDDNTYEWVATGVTPEKDNLQNVPPEACENWYKSFAQGETIIIPDIEDIKDENPLQYDILKQQDISSIVVVPLYIDDRIIGFYGVDNPPSNILEYASDMLQIMGHFITSSIRRRNLLNELKFMSHHDQLTGLGNRHAMDKFLAELPKDKELGVVYCDITGLKLVNDTEGHKKGDELILAACRALKNSLGRHRLFRIGGDEFLCLCSNVERDELDKDIIKLKANMIENSVNMSVGLAWSEAGSGDIDKIISEAEKNMYEDKIAYYEATGIEKRII